MLTITNLRSLSRALALAAFVIALVAASNHLRADTGTCGGAMLTLPFTDVPSSNVFFCSIAEAFFSGLTSGTTSTTYGPSQAVPREQMAAFVSRTLDQSLRRGNRRAALGQWWTSAEISHLTNLTCFHPQLIGSDGADIWAAFEDCNAVYRVQASSGRVVQAWVATSPYGVSVARGRVYVTGNTTPGHLLSLDPTVSTITQTAHLEADNLGAFPRGIAYDGLRIWTANFSGSVSIRSFGSVPEDDLTTTVNTGFIAPIGILYDGANIWVADPGDDQLKKLNAGGSIAASVPVGSDPFFPVFDGTNIWVPNKLSNSVTVVRVKDSAGNPLAQPFVLATLTGNGLNFPVSAAFDGQRILITNFNGNSVSLWKAADLTPLGFVTTGTNSGPVGACSDGVNFWISLNSLGTLARF